MVRMGSLGAILPFGRHIGQTGTGSFRGKRWPSSKVSDDGYKSSLAAGDDASARAFHDA
jgi:hypothetical protein